MSYEEEDTQRVLDALKTLQEHFDCVHIFATRHEPEIEDGTVSINYGVGNWYSRFGNVREWIVKQEERMRDSVRHHE